MSCSQTGLTPGDDQSSLDQTGEFARTSFDGCWDWYESSVQTYRVIIADGEIASLTPAGRSTMSLSGSDGNCLISPQDGLVALTYAAPAAAGESRRITTFRFDLRDAQNSSMPDSMSTGMIRGRKTVEDTDPDDILPLPPSAEQDGYLMLCDSN